MEGAVDRFELVDAHVHFWDHSIDGLQWPYLEPGFEHPRLKGMYRIDSPRFTVPELRAQAGGITLNKVVHVQSAQERTPGLETAWVESVAAEHGTPHAIVAKAPLASPAVGMYLAASAAHPRFRGVRDMGAPATISTAEFTAGFDAVADRGWSTELLVPHPLYDEVAVLAERRPAATIVLGHAGLAERRDPDYFAAWSAGLAALARHPNIVVKISALASGADPGWTVRSLTPWVRQCVECFGPDRAMFASNWPIDSLHGTYPRLIDAYRTIVAHLTPSEQRALFVSTAERVYRI